MKKLYKILKEVEKLKKMYKESSLSLIDKGNLPCEYDKSDIESAKMQAISEAITIMRKHMNDGWISVDKKLPEDLYTPSELYEKWFLITTPFGEEKVVQRTRCVPTGYVWFDGYDSVRVIAWTYIEPYRLERSRK